MDYTLGDTIYHAFTTRAFATGVPTALAGSPTVEIYENDSTSPIVEGASKLVLTQNLNSINGFNLVTITATSGNGFEAGKTYHTVVKTGTVGGTSIVGEVIFRFTLQASAAAVDLANGTDGLGAIKTDTAAILADTGTDGVVVASGSKTGYSLSSSQTFNVTGNITGNLSGSVGSVTTVSDKTGYSLAASQTFNTTGNITGNLSGSVGSVTATVNADVKKINAVTIVGDGSGTPFNV